MKDYAFKISGILNVNKILPNNGNWNYRFLDNGNILIHGSPSDTDIFSHEEYNRKIIENGGKLECNNGITNIKQIKMSETANTPTEELIDIEKGIESYLEEGSEQQVENTYVSIVLTSNNKIPTPSSGFQKDLMSFLGSKMNDEIRTRIKSKLEQIKSNLKSGNITGATITLPTCNPEIGDTKITIKDEDYVSGSLKISIETTIADVKCLSSKSYPVSGNKFSSQDIIHALTEFSAGRTFLKGLTTSVETFKPKE
ncbi:hypothetical protein [Saccharicrinis aurantiacus]|uniref:hypothetical protein n=1 Tax=Saccharicrinis aurantiacus TaxID=1849719 RepID=UPI0008387138|nr:hypothetical protein [Saccharicrinis aurantiacus]